MLIINFIRLCNNHSIFVHDDDKLLIIYVDDLLIYNFKKKNLYFKKKFTKHFRVKNLNLNLIFFYLSAKIMRNRENRVIHFNQTTYIK